MVARKLVRKSVIPSRHQSPERDRSEFARELATSLAPTTAVIAWCYLYMVVAQSIRGARTTAQ